MSVNLSVGKYGESDKTTLKNMQYFVRFSYPCGLEKSIFSYKFKEISCTDLQGVIFKNVHGNTDLNNNNKKRNNMISDRTYKLWYIPLLDNGILMVYTLVKMNIAI